MAKDKRASRRGQLTKAKLKPAEFKSKELDSVPPYVVQTCLAKLKKDIHLHEAIQQRYQELMEEGKAQPDVDAEEEDSAAETHEEHLDLLRQMEEYLECFNCVIKSKNLRAKYSMFRDTMSMETPEFESESLTLRAAFEDLMDQILTLSLEEVGPLRTEVAGCQKPLLEQLHEFRKRRHRKTPEPTASSTESSTTTSRSRGPKIKMEMPSFSGEPTEWRHFHRLFTSAMDGRGRGFTDHEKVCILLKSMAHPEAQRIVQAHTHSDEGYADALKALTTNTELPGRSFLS